MRLVIQASAGMSRIRYLSGSSSGSIGCSLVAPFFFWNWRVGRKRGWHHERFTTTSSPVSSCLKSRAESRRVTRFTVLVAMHVPQTRFRVSSLGDRGQPTASFRRQRASHPSSERCCSRVKSKAARRRVAARISSRGSRRGRCGSRQVVFFVSGKSIAAHLGHSTRAPSLRVVSSAWHSDILSKCSSAFRAKQRNCHRTGATRGCRHRVTWWQR